MGPRAAPRLASAPMRSRAGRPLLCALATAVALSVTACGGGGDDGAITIDEPPAPTTEQPSAAAADETASIDDGTDDDGPADETASIDDGTDDDGPADETASIDDGTDSDAEAAEAAFEAYRSAILATDGAAAVELVTPSTIEWYDRLLVASREAGPSELLETLPILDALSVLSTRISLRADLASIEDGRELFVIGVEQGLIGDDVQTLEIDRYRIDPLDALGYVDDVPAIRLERRDADWLVDLTHIGRLIEESGEESFIAGITGGSTDRQELFEGVAFIRGTTWEEVSQPPQP